MDLVDREAVWLVFFRQRFAQEPYVERCARGGTLDTHDAEPSSSTDVECPAKNARAAWAHTCNREHVAVLGHRACLRTRSGTSERGIVRRDREPTAIRGWLRREEEGVSAHGRGP